MNKLTPQKFLETFEGFDFDEAFTDHELEQITNSMSAYHKYASSPPSPVGIEVEALADKYANSFGYKSDKEQYNTTPWIDWNIRNEAFKAGYAASQKEIDEEDMADIKMAKELANDPEMTKIMEEINAASPQSSTSEEEKMWMDVKELFHDNYNNYNYPMQAINELLSTYKISKR